MKAVKIGAGLLLGGLALGTYAGIVERLWMWVDRKTVKIPGCSLPAGGLRILHLSDFHFNGRDKLEPAKLTQIQRAIASLNYDIAAITGDLIHADDGVPLLIELIAGLKPRLGTYACLGNHDHIETPLLGMKPKQIATLALNLVSNSLIRVPIGSNDLIALRDAIQAAGGRLLVNEAIELPGAPGLWLAAVDDWIEGDCNLERAMRSVPQEATTILLAHNPDIMLEPGLERMALILCGHTHGGQITLPGVGALHTQGTHLSRRHPAGWFEVEGAGVPVHVSRGLGEGIPFRFFCPPQISLITLVNSTM